MAAGLLALGLEPGDRVGIWSPNNAEWVVTQFATADRRPHPRQHQSGLPPRRGRVRAQQGRMQGADHRAVVQDQRLCWDAAHPRAGKPQRPAGRPRRPATAVRTHPHPSRCRARNRIPCASPRSRPWAAPPKRARLVELKPRLQFDDAINIQFTSGTTGAPEGRDADPPQHPQQRLLHRRGDAAHRRATACASRVALCITASAWCWAISPASPMARRWFIPARFSAAGRCSRPSPPSAAPRSTACRQCTSPSSTTPDFARYDLSQPAHRHHGGIALPDRDHAAHDQRHAHARRHDLLRHDRDEPGQHRDRPRRSARAAGRNGRPRSPPTSRSRWSMPRAASCRPARRASYVRAAIRSCSAIGTIQKRPPRRSTPPAGCTPAISDHGRGGLRQHRRPASRTW